MPKAYDLTAGQSSKHTLTSTGEAPLAYKNPKEGGVMRMHCPPIICPPRYCVRDCYIPRMVPYVHPIVNVNRHVIVNVPQHFYQPMTRNVVVDPGCPGYRPGY